jgi:hypothetical protein
MFCDETCEESYREDHSRGLIYGCVAVEDSRGVVRYFGWEEACSLLEECYYCAEPIQAVTTEA